MSNASYILSSAGDEKRRGSYGGGGGGLASALSAVSLGDSVNEEVFVCQCTDHKEDKGKRKRKWEQ